MSSTDDLAIKIDATRPVSNMKETMLQYRPPLNDPQLPVVGIWSEKSACTCVVKWFFMQMGLLDEALKHSKWIHDYENAVFKKQPDYLATALNAIQNGVPVLKFVRDPYARSYSGYLEVNRDVCVTAPRHWGYNYRRRILRDLALMDANVEYGFTFRTYLQWLGKQNTGSLNNHIRDQFLLRDEFMNITCLQIERLEEAFDWLESSYDLPSTKGRRQEIFDSSHHHAKTDQLSREQSLAILDLALPVRKAGHFELVAFDKTMAAGSDFDGLVRKIFGKDIDLYGYGDAVSDRHAESNVTHESRGSSERQAVRPANRLMHVFDKLRGSRAK